MAAAAKLREHQTQHAIVVLVSDDTRKEAIRLQ